MSNTDYIPRVESIFYPWAKNLVTLAAGDEPSAQWAIPVEARIRLSELFGVYEAKYLVAIDPATRTKIAVQAKNDARTAFTAALRAFCRSHLLYNERITGADRNLLQLPIRDTKPTPVPPPHTSPVGVVDTSTHQRHTIRVSDSVEISKRGGLPAGVHGFETWRKTGGGQPASDSDFVYLNFSSTTTLVVDYPLDVVGTTVWYRFRWVNARNEPGPWSESIIGAVVA